MKPVEDNAFPAAECSGLLALLEASDGDSQAVDGERFLIRRAGQNHAFPMDLVRHCLRQGLVRAKGSRLRIAAAGRASLQQPGSDETGSRDLHLVQTIDPTRAGSGHVRVNLAESPLSRLNQRRDTHGKAFLAESEFSAGERLRAEFERAGLQPRISANWEAPVASGGRGGTAAEISDLAIDARRRLGRAIDALGPELSGIALDVCCFLKGLEQVERERRWPPRSAKLMLKSALSLLARHYGLSGMAAARAKVRHWGDADYRPAMVRGGT
jgi:hypothetical protein